MARPDASAELRLAGVRVTAPRLSVLQRLADQPYAAVAQIRAGVCRSCGRTEDVDCAVGPSMRAGRASLSDAS